MLYHDGADHSNLAQVGTLFFDVKREEAHEPFRSGEGELKPGQAYCAGLGVLISPGLEMVSCTSPFLFLFRWC